MKTPVALTIAGSDSGGGAGIQADLKTFAALGVHGCVAITAITAQNTTSVTHVLPMSPEIVDAQITAIMKDMKIQAAKTGMLFSRDIIRVVARCFTENQLPLVVDPVMISKSGALLLKGEAVQSLTEELLPIATIVTPNSPEAERLVGVKIKNQRDAAIAAKKIAKMGPEAVVVKGGHIDTGDIITDIMFTRGKIFTFENKRINTRSTHGTGCTFSAAIAAELAKGKNLLKAVEVANRFANEAIRTGFNIGKGFGPVNPVGNLLRNAERITVLENVSEAVKMLESSKEITELIPEVQSNLAMALPDAKTHDDVAAIHGRIVKVANRVQASSPPSFGASRHLANTIIAVMQFDERFRAAMNIRFSPEILAACKSLGFSYSSYDRRREPLRIKEIEGSTTRWGANEAVKKAGRVPDVIYHEGDWGKEAMVIILGQTATEVVERALRVARKLSERRGSASS